MSGIEITGLILGSIPLVISALEHYADGVRTIDRWRKFDRELKSLVRVLGNEYDIFLNTCEKLLSGIVPYREISFLIQKPGGPAWSDPDIERKLKARLWKSFPRYLETVQDMASALDEFKLRLDLSPDVKSRWTDAASIKREFKRVKFVFGKSDYDGLLRRIKDDNTMLFRLTDQNIELERARHGRRQGAALKIVRNFARSVYSVLCSALKCACQEPHDVSLRLESRVCGGLVDEDDYEHALEDLRFRVVLSYNRDALRMQSAAWQWEEVDICPLRSTDELNTVALTSQGPSQLASAKRVRFAEPAKAGVMAKSNIPSALTPISDLCRTMQHIKEQQGEAYLGFLVDEYTQKHGVFLPDCSPSQTKTWSILSLRDLLNRKKDGRQILTRTDRLHLAVILASSVLQLGQTPWVDSKWGKDDIFIKHNEGPIYERVFISRTFSPDKPSFNQLALMDSSSMPFIVPNESVFSLGIILIELCLGACLEELRTPADAFALDGSANVLTDIMTARRVETLVYQEGGGRYGDAVRRCIRCDFDQRYNSLEDDAFRQAVYDGVVCLLEDDLRQFQCLT